MIILAAVTSAKDTTPYTSPVAVGTEMRVILAFIVLFCPDLSNPETRRKAIPGTASVAPLLRYSAASGAALHPGDRHGADLRAGTSMAARRTTPGTRPPSPATAATTSATSPAGVSIYPARGMPNVEKALNRIPGVSAVLITLDVTLMSKYLLPSEFPMGSRHPSCYASGQAPDRLRH